MDSSNSKMTLQSGEVVKSKSNARYNKKNELVQLYTLNEKGAPVEMISNEIDKKGNVLSIAYTRYGDEPSFMQTFYEYNEKGQILNTVNTVNQKQEYKYDAKGLITNIMSYNPKGVLEIEYIFKYFHHK
jgi:YD repeat-containing protein